MTVHIFGGFVNAHIETAQRILQPFQRKHHSLLHGFVSAQLNSNGGRFVVTLVIAICNMHFYVKWVGPVCTSRRALL